MVETANSNQSKLKNASSSNELSLDLAAFRSPAIASLLVAASMLSVSTAQSATINDWTDMSLWTNGAPTDQTLVPNGFTFLHAQHVAGNGELLDKVSIILGKGSNQGDLNTGSFADFQYNIWVGPIADFNPASTNFSSHYIKSFSMPTNTVLVGNIGGIDQYRLEFPVADCKFQLNSGQEYLISVVPVATTNTLALATYADPGVAAIGSLVDYQYSIENGTRALNDSVIDPGWHKLAMAATTYQQVVVSEDLKIALDNSGTNVVVSWNSEFNQGKGLLETTNIIDGPWLDTPGSQGTNSIRYSVSEPQKYFRLKK